jgi:hypothetical protein
MDLKELARELDALAPGKAAGIGVDVYLICFHLANRMSPPGCDALRSRHHGCVIDNTIDPQRASIWFVKDSGGEFVY